MFPFVDTFSSKIELQMPWCLNILTKCPAVYKKYLFVIDSFIGVIGTSKNTLTTKTRT